MRRLADKPAGRNMGFGKLKIMASVGFIALGLAGVNYLMIDSQKPKTPEHLAYKLARLDHGTQVKGTHDSQVIKYERLLLEIEAKCVNSPMDLGDIAIRIQEAIKGRTGKTVSLYDLMNAANRLMSRPGRKYEFAQVMMEVMRSYS